MAQRFFTRDDDVIVMTDATTLSNSDIDALNVRLASAGIKFQVSVPWPNVPADMMDGIVGELRGWNEFTLP